MSGDKVSVPAEWETAVVLFAIDIVNGGAGTIFVKAAESTSRKIVCEAPESERISIITAFSSTRCGGCRTEERCVAELRNVVFLVSCT